MLLYLVFIAIIATLTAAQNSSANIFLPTAFLSDVEFAASIIGVCSGQTLYDIKCTSGIFAETVTCAPDAPVEFTITENPTMFAASTATPFSGAVQSITESCSLNGTTAAVCTTTVLISQSTTSVFTATTNTLLGTDIPAYYMYQIPVTASGSIAAGSCSNAATGTKTVAIGTVIGLAVLIISLVL